MSCCTPITLVPNTLKNIYLCGPLWDEFTPEYYNENNDAIGMSFQQYADSAVENIYHPYTVIEFKYNMDKANYEENQDSGIYIPYEKRQLS